MTVHYRSPFRYPGGKTWLIPKIRLWLHHLQTKPNLFIEPFAGGAIVGLTVAFEKLADLTILVEYDGHVASVWQTLINGEYGQGYWLAEQVHSFILTETTLQDALSKVETTSEGIALQTILHNRTSHGGRLDCTPEVRQAVKVVYSERKTTDHEPQATHLY